MAAVFAGLRDHVQMLPQLVSQSHYFFTQPSLAPLTSSALSSHHLTPATASTLLSSTLAALPSSHYESAAVTTALKRVVESEGVEVRVLYWLLRMALTMEGKGPSLSEMVCMMGPQRVTQRLTSAKEALHLLHEERQQQQGATATAAVY